MHLRFGGLPGIRCEPIYHSLLTEGMANMAEFRAQSDSQNETRTSNDSGRGRSSASTATMPGREASLVTEHGRTNIADIVVSKIVARAAREVSGVHDLTTGGVGGAIGGFASRLSGSDSGVNVEVGQKEAAVDIAMIVDYGVSIPQVAEGVRRSIMNRVNAMTGLQVREVNVDVADLFLPEAQGDDNQQHQRVQ